jgi:hypothetical protein
VRFIRNTLRKEKNTSSIAQSDAPSRAARPVRLHLLEHPTVIAFALLLFILSGPPRLRFRDPEASLHGDIDWVVAINVAVWCLAGLWVCLQMLSRLYRKRPLIRMRMPQVLGLALVVCLAASSFVSAAPELTAYKVYQVLVSMLFTQLFFERFGAMACLKGMLWGNGLLCVAIAICAFAAPEMVWTPSDFDPDPTRLFGTLIAPTGVVAVLAIVLLLTSIRNIAKPIPLFLLAMFFGLLALSLMRTAYVATLAFFALVLLKRPNVKLLRRFTYLFVGLLLVAYACAWLPKLSRYRDPQSISTLSDRTGLWRYLTEVTLSRSPWFGLGYYSASRTYGLEYNPGLGTAHSAFFEVLSGGGVVSFTLFLALCLTLSVYAVRILWGGNDRLPFAIASLFIVTVLFASMVDEIDSGPIAVSFWCAAAILPRLQESLLKRAPQRAESSPRLPLRVATESEAP